MGMEGEEEEQVEVVGSIERPPGYVEDEGVGLDEADELDGLEDDTIEDEEPPAYSAGLGGLMGRASGQDWTQPGWNWDGTMNRHAAGAALGSDDEPGDAASDTAANGSNAGDSLGDRMLEDFGDEMGPRPGNVSPMSTEEMPDLVGEVGDPPVAEVRLEEEWKEGKDE